MAIVHPQAKKRKMISGHLQKRKSRNFLISTLQFLIVVLEFWTIQLYVDQEWMLAPYAVVVSVLLGILVYLKADDDALICLSLHYYYIIIMAFLGPHVPMGWAAIEVLCLAYVLNSIHLRPWIRTEKLDGTVGIAFYYGSNCPLLARLVSIIGVLPARSVAIVVNGKAMVPTTKGYIECREARALKMGWLILDTGKRPTDLFLHYFHDLKGEPVSKTGCVKSMEHIIRELGFEPGRTPGRTQQNLMEWRC